MLGLGAIHAGIAVVALVSMQVGNECASLGGAFFGPEFTKAYNTPTEREKKALEERQQQEKNERDASEALVKAYSADNIRKGSQMDFTEIDKAATLSRDPLVAAWKYGMLIAAGKTREAEQIGSRVEQMYRDFGIEPNQAKAQQLDATSMTTRSILAKMDANDPNRAAVKDDLCKQYRTFFATPSGYTPESLQNIRAEQQQAGCS